MKRFLTTILAASALVAASSPSVFAQDITRVVPSSNSQVQLSFSPIVKQAAPAVVNIFTSRTVRTRSRSSFFDEMFGMQRAPRERVIVRSNGIIVTNAHVVKGADELKVVLNDRREFEATVVAQDEETDLAVLRIDTEGEIMPTLRVGADDDPEIGDLVLAIGNPFGVGQTVTSGIISALGRTNVSDISSAIQTDAAVNPGNSGGALVNLNGELIGVNTALFSRSGGSNGIGFAIPAELVERAIESALSEGRIVRPWIGARTNGVDATMAAALGLDRAKGAVINELLDGGPADKAGLSKGDVILSVGGTDINDDSGLRFKLATLKPREHTEIKYVRDGRTRTARVRVDTPKESPERDERELEGIHPFNGATIVNMSPALGEELGFDPYLEGVMVLKVIRRSAANFNRLRAGDLILSVNGTSVSSASRLESMLASEPVDVVWDVEIDRDGRIGTLPIRYLPPQN